MGNLDIYYRAFKEYRKETANDTLCVRDRRELSQAGTENDVLNATKYLCKIEEDWIKAIEEGLVYVEKAVAEERQFIRTNGEVIPIEKVRHISKDSVEHLAKHSEMITHLPEEDSDTIVPDKLYMTEKLSDYAVYENRFLYMMLCYLRDFIDYRLEKIETLRRTYIGNMHINKEIKSKKRTLVVETKVFEKRTDNPFPIADTRSAALVKRISDCMSIINSLLNTDLMTQVAKSPMIKPPIVKTNVLKMNNNFKRSLALYDYIASYRGDGYSYEEVYYDLAPYSETLADEMAEAANVTAFLSYRYGNDITEELERRYQEEEIRRRKAEEDELAERIKRMKKRALESNKTLEEYMLLLEKRNKMLERDSEDLALIRHDVEKLNEKIAELYREQEEYERRIADLENTIEQKNAEIVALNQKYIEDMSALKKQHEEELVLIAGRHENEITALKAEHSERLNATIEEYELKAAGLHEEIDALNNKLFETVEECNQRELICEEQRQNLFREKAQLERDFEAKTQELGAEYLQRQQELSADYAGRTAAYEADAQQRIADANARHDFAQGQLDAMRVQQGLLAANPNDTSRERFMELQAEYLAFERYFKEQWKLTKKEIRKQVFWKKWEKKKKAEAAPAEQAPPAQPEQPPSPVEEQSRQFEPELPAEQREAETEEAQTEEVAEDTQDSEE
ncbi:MAG: hypothetical protein K2N84_05715 [Clostridia bacterium]|nr:hypothetical protein [Clostridia bacterium]